MTPERKNRLHGRPPRKPKPFGSLDHENDQPLFAIVDGKECFDLETYLVELRLFKRRIWPPRP